MSQRFEFISFFLAFLALTGLGMAMRFYLYGPADALSRLARIFG